MTCSVFGRRAGQYAAEYAKRLLKMSDINADEVENAARQLVAAFDGGGAENPYAVMQDIQTCMENNAGIIRTKAELERGPRRAGAAQSTRCKAQGGGLTPV